VVAPDDEQQLDDLARRESVTDGGEGRIANAWQLKRLGGKAKDDSRVGVKARGLKVAVLYRGNLLVADAQCPCDADVLHPLIFRTGACGDEQDRQLAQLGVELQLCEQDACET